MSWAAPGAPDAWWPKPARSGTGRPVPGVDGSCRVLGALDNKV